jgi:hypothetical protein
MSVSGLFNQHQLYHACLPTPLPVPPRIPMRHSGGFPARHAAVRLLRLADTICSPRPRPDNASPQFWQTTAGTSRTMTTMLPPRRVTVPRAVSPSLQMTHLISVSHPVINMVCHLFATFVGGDNIEAASKKANKRNHCDLMGLGFLNSKIEENRQPLRAQSVARLNIDIGW